MNTAKRVLDECFTLIDSGADKYKTLKEVHHKYRNLISADDFVNLIRGNGMTLDSHAVFGRKKKLKQRD